MNSTTSLFFTSFSMNCSIAMITVLCVPRIRCAGVQPRETDSGAVLDICSARALHSPDPRGAQSGTRSRSGVGYPRLQRQGVQLAAHLALKRLIDQLVLLDARFTLEGCRNHGCGIVIAVANEIADGHLGVRNAG